MQISTDQWRASLGVRDSESCWFTEEIGTYMRCWESPGDLPLVIEIVVSSRSFRCAPLAKRHKISITREDHPIFPKNVCKNLLINEQKKENKGTNNDLQNTTPKTKD